MISYPVPEPRQIFKQSDHHCSKQSAHTQKKKKSAETLIKCLLINWVLFHKAGILILGTSHEFAHLLCDIYYMQFQDKR